MSDFLTSGGPFMYAILTLSVIAGALIIERFFALQFLYKHNKKFFKQIVRSVKKQNYSAAIKMCSSTSHPLAVVLLGAIKNRDMSIEAIESSVNVTISKVIPKIQKRTNYIQMIGNIATLVGLLGTIQGLILSFSSLAGAEASEKAALLAQGISTAMNTTAFGLIVAIPCIVCFTILSNKENAVLQSYDETVQETIHLLGHIHKEGELKEAA